MLFDYKLFKEGLWINASKKHIIEKWEKYSQSNFITDEPFFKYVKMFKSIPYKVPEELKDDFDWELLLQITASSFSSDFAFVFPENKEITEEALIPDLSIIVTSGKQKVTKVVSELWSFQISRLFEIYCEEQINLHMLKVEDENEKNAIEYEQMMRIKKYESKLNETQNLIKRNSCFI